MNINIQNLYFPEVKVISPKVFGDERGFFLETFNSLKFDEIGIQDKFIQDNLSMSKRGTLRGLHYQLLNPQDKLVFVTYGKVLDVIVDIRLGSPKFGHFQTIELDATKIQFIFIPKGFAHGFITLSKEAIFQYKCSEYYYPEDQYSILWKDKDINISWPKNISPILSLKDKSAKTLEQIKREKLLPKYHEE
tara:strand:- start:593 stop:1165 length:573 start_codon:yes stop_codon:yes gene_type:complete